jgi:hypothetical protein
LQLADAPGFIKVSLYLTDMDRALFKFPSMFTSTEKLWSVQLSVKNTFNLYFKDDDSDFNDFSIRIGTGNYDHEAVVTRLQVYNQIIIRSIKQRDKQESNRYCLAFHLLKYIHALQNSHLL